MRLEYPAGLPRNFRGDPTRLRQVFLNLVGNAIKFTDKGEVTVKVATAPETDNRDSSLTQLTFSVNDTGIGIPKEKQKDIFEAFSQADTSITRKYSGSGLGLTITQSLLSLMGSSVSVNSEPGNGAEFYFTLCLKPGRAVAEKQMMPAGIEAVRGTRVLVVEDNPINQRLMGLLLEQLGCVHEMAANGRDAVDKAVNHGYDLILMDVQMPVMDGYEATKIIRAGGSTVPIIALTAHALKEDKEKCRAAGMNDFIAKPVEINELRHKVLIWGGKPQGATAE
jgi:CheY-like chemotaxis protein